MEMPHSLDRSGQMVQGGLPSSWMPVQGVGVPSADRFKLEANLSEVLTAAEFMLCAQEGSEK